MSWDNANSFGGGSTFDQNAGGFSGSQFGGGGGGGGFLNEGDNKFGSQPNFSQSQSPATARKRDEQFLTPVTIKQIMNAEQRESKFKIDGKDVAQITLVGVILTVEPQPTNINYTIDDGSGKMNVRLYVDMDGDNKHNVWQVGMYVRVIGNLRLLGNQPSVVGFQLLPITDFNELTCHSLEVIHTHLYNTKGPPGAAGGQTNNQQQGVQNNNMNNGMGQQNNVNSNVIGADGYTHGAAPTGGNVSLNDQVMKVFNADTNDAGCHIDEVCKLLPNLSRADVQKAIEYLSDEGHLYSTISEQHFKSTAAS